MPKIKQAAEEMLLHNIIPFWKGMRDEENGGFYGYMDFDLKLDKKAEKGCILNSRILWFFSEAAMLTGRADLAEDARHAYQFFLKNCYDEANGGVYWSCDYTGKPQDTTKHTYNQGFAIYALSAYYRLTKDPVALTYAKKIFHLIEQHCTDSEGYLEAFTIDWKLESNEKLSENGVMAAKTMNTLLHVFEGYAGLYQASRDPEVEKALRRILDIYEHKIYSPELHRQLVFFDQHYNSIIDLYSYGHDIESSWLIDWGCDLLGDAALSKRITHAVIDEEIITSPRRYHTITEAKNGEGATPIKTEKGWLHIAHGVRNTAAGLRYVIYVFVTALDDPSKVIAEPSGFLIAPRDWERVGDVSNVVFTNGAIADEDGSVYIYYAASDTRLHVASTTIDKLLDFAFNTPADPLRSVDCVKQRCALIDKNLAYLRSIWE